MMTHWRVRLQGSSCVKQICLSICCLVVVSASPQSAEKSGASAKSGLTFINALPTKRGIEFDSPIEINWRALAPRRYENPSRSELAEFEKQKDMFDNTEKEYIVSIVPELARRHFYLFSSDGVVELKVERMIGTVRFGFLDPGRARIDYGELIGVAKTGTLPQGGGFVAATPDAEEFENSAVGMSLSKLGDALRQVATGDDIRKSPELWRIIKATRLRRVKTGESYYFVQFAPDTECKELCCLSSYSLTTAANSPKFVATINYDCDI
jgi:hypothetical protein